MKAVSVILLAVMILGVSAVGYSYTMPTGHSLSAEAIEAMRYGNVWWDPNISYTSPGQRFSTNLVIDSLGNSPGAITMEVTYDESVVKCLGASYTWLDPNVAAAKGNIVLNNYDPGKLRISGFSVQGFGSSSQLRLITINWLAVSNGIVSLNLTVEKLANREGNEISGWGQSGAVVVR